ncbi:hypothetical protein Dsin_031604 [Dipteronia sinensis]|uniref:Uncharacterized protein n=1 Tax=Dipteronia sinensis TaxID=43782 RepID=A0AAD9ZM83_9ROSI|nr:hypothetical protein Dsin_031604 [Dipteronia sinensis]
MMMDAIEGWKICKIKGSSRKTLRSKIKETKARLRNWITSNKKKDVFINKLEVNLAEIDSKAKIKGWYDNLRLAHLSLLSELWKSLRVEEQSWRQKSRVKRRKEGDKNSNFFHLIANDRRRRNFIDGISFNGVVLSDPSQVREEVLHFFKKHFENVPWVHPKINDLSLKRLSTGEKKGLEAEFNEEKVWEALNGCDGNKSTGPDGLILNFIKAN